MLTNRGKEAINLNLDPRDSNASILINHLLCTPSWSGNNIVIRNIDTGQSKALKCANIRKLVHLPRLGFASFAEYENGFLLQIWKVSGSEVTKLGKPRTFTGEKEKIDFNSLFAVSPDSRYLAIKTHYREVYRQSYGSEHVAFTGLLIIDTLKEKAYCHAVSEDKGTYSRFDRFEIVFTQPRQLAVFHPKEGWLSLYNLHSDENENIHLKKQIEKQQISDRDSTLEILPSPKTNHWFIKIEYNSSISFYLLDPANVTRKPKYALKHVHTLFQAYNLFHAYKSASVLKIQWLDERIIMHMQYRPDHPASYRDTIEIYDLEYHERLVIDIENIKDFTLTERGELFILKTNNEYELRQLPKSKVKQLLQQHPETHATPFVCALQDTAGTNKLSRDLHLLIQDFAREPMHSLFFQPAKAAIKKQTAASVRRSIDKKITALQKRKSHIQQTLICENTELRSELKQLMIDSLVLHLLKNKISQDTTQSIKDSIEEALETGSSIQPVSFELLQFLDSLKMSLGSKIEIKCESLSKPTSTTQSTLRKTP